MWCLGRCASPSVSSWLPPRSSRNNPADSPHSTGRTVSPETEGKQQPQGPTGPLNTTKGGAPAESPQGQTPPGMQVGARRVVKDHCRPEILCAASLPQTAKDPVPPATDKSEATRAGTQEPSSKVEGTSKNEKGAFDKGTLTAPGALTDVDTAPAKYSARTAADDALPIAGYALRHLTDDQRRAILSSVRNERSAGPAANADVDFAKVGALVPTAVALSALKPLPDSATASLPEMKAVMFTTVGQTVVLINPRTRVVIGVLEP